MNGEVGFNPNYYANSYYTWGSRAVSLGLTWRIGKMELQSCTRRGVRAPSL